MIKKIKRQFFLYNLLVLITTISISCGPQIHSFDIKPRTINSTDTVRIDWDVSGEPTLLFHEMINPQDSSKTIREFILVVQKGDKEKKKIIEVEVLPKRFSGKMIFETRLSGDTLIVSEESDTTHWGHNFKILTISLDSGRYFTMTHDNKVVQLNNDGLPSKSFEGTPLEGLWEIRTLLNDEEKADRKKIPNFITIKFTAEKRK